MKHDTKGSILKKAVVWKDLYFYRKSDTIYQLTVEFCKRFLPSHGDRTVDQMVQAFRNFELIITTILIPITCLYGLMTANVRNVFVFSVIPTMTIAPMLH